MISDRERESRDYLFKLMQENPELPVIPFVDKGHHRQHRPAGLRGRP